MEVLSYMIRVRGGKEGKKDAEAAAAGMDKFGNSLTDADVAMGRFIDTQGRMRESNGQFVKGLERGAEALRRNGRAAGGFHRDLARARATVVSMGTQLGVMVGALALLAPALIAVGASASAAVLGTGIIGGAGLLAFAASLGGVFGIAKSIVGQLDKVRSAQDQLNLTIAQYGANSEEATDAQIKFNAVLSENGGAGTLALLEKVNRLTSRWGRLTERARRSVQRTFGSGLDLANRLLPVVAGETNRGASAVSAAAADTGRQLGGKEMQENIVAFGRAGSAAIGPLASGLTDVVFALFRLLRPALPYVVKAAEAFEDWAHGLRSAAGDGEKLSGFIDMLVGHMRSWWELAKALGDTLRILFGGSAEEGRSFVDSLTGSVEQFNAWLEAARDSGELQKFFQDSLDILRAIGDVLVWTTNAFIWLRDAAEFRPGTKQAYYDIRDWIIGAARDTMEWIVTAWNDTITFLSGVPGRISAALSGMWDGIKDGFRSAINWVIERWNSLDFSFPGKKIKGLPDIPGFSIGVPDIPLLAEGGNVRVGGAAVVGDAGPEVLNLPAGAQVTPLPNGTAAPMWPGGDIVFKVGRNVLGRMTAAEISAQMARGG